MRTKFSPTCVLKYFLVGLAAVIVDNTSLPCDAIFLDNMGCIPQAKESCKENHPDWFKAGDCTRVAREYCCQQNMEPLCVTEHPDWDCPRYAQEYCRES